MEILPIEQVDPTTIRFRVRVSPGAKRAGMGGVHDGSLKIAVTQPPENGKANQAVIHAIAKRLGVSKSSVTVVSGLSSRVKTLQAVGVSIAHATQRFGL